MRCLFAVASFLCFFSGSIASANSPSLDLIDDAVLAKIRGVLSHPIVLISVKAQNSIYGDLDEAAILKLDKQWRAETKSDDQPLIASVMSVPLSTFLTLQQAQHQGLFSEVFVMDRNGLNVGQGAVTSDYWQGDEAKFLKTFPVGPDAVFIDEPEFNEDFKTWRAQVSLTFSREGEKLGVATFEVNLTELERLKSAR
tara:strand:+ start:1044 stop:1634 length:591 start_codon:yes stop_codon:yes gene_type:complete